MARADHSAFGRYANFMDSETPIKSTQQEYASASQRRITKICQSLGCRSYLEIGVESGFTFFQIEIDEKTGVDPAFLFDWEEFDGQDGVTLHNCTSDEFFRTLPEQTVYDFIFVDGLHTFEQTYRDILQSLKHSHARSVILIDDTIPSDVFSTCREQDKCIKLRHSHTGTIDRSWHGDTYKVVPLLTAFNPELELLTIMNHGNPQTLLWKPLESGKKEDPFRTMQAMWAIQNLASTDYLWLLDNISLYNPVTEEEGLNTIIQRLSS